MCKRLLVLMLVALAGCTPPASPVATKPGSAPDPASTPGSAAPPTFVHVSADEPFQISEAGGAWEVTNPHLYVIAPHHRATFSATVTVHQVLDQSGISAGSGFSIDASPSLPVPIVVSRPVDEATVEAVSKGKLVSMERANGSWQATSDVPVAAFQGQVTSLILRAGTFGLGEALPLLGSEQYSFHDQNDAFLYDEMTRWPLQPIVIADPDLGPCWVGFEKENPPAYSNPPWGIILRLAFNSGSAGDATGELVVHGTFSKGIASFTLTGPESQKVKHYLFVVKPHLPDVREWYNIKAYLLSDTLTALDILDPNVDKVPPFPDWPWH